MVVTGVGTLIHIYSVSYMSHEDEQGFAKFFTYLNLFVAAMLVLVLGDSLILTFVGWEGVGLCSYLLIGFWYTDPMKAFAGRKAFVTNRVGDFGFLVGVFVLVSLFGTVSYGDLQSRAMEIAEYVKRAPSSTAASSPAGPGARPSRWRSSASSSAPAASPPRSRSTSGCPTRWRARPRSPPSSTRPPW